MLEKIYRNMSECVQKLPRWNKQTSFLGGWGFDFHCSFNIPLPLVESFLHSRYNSGLRVSSMNMCSLVLKIILVDALGLLWAEEENGKRGCQEVLELPELFHFCFYK